MRSAPQVAYMIWILVSTVGLLQALAARHSWTGLSFFRGHKLLGYLCAVVLVPVSYSWFFSLTDRNVPGLEGWQLFSRFALAVGGGVLVTLAASSVLNSSMRQAVRGQPDSALEHGLDALRHDTYWHLLRTATARSLPLRLLRLSQHRSWTRLFSLLAHLSATSRLQTTRPLAVQKPPLGKEGN